MENSAQNINLAFQVRRERLTDGSPVFVAHCVEIDITDQGETEEIAFDNAVRAVRLWFETASTEEVAVKLAAVRRRKTRTFTTQLEVPNGQIAGVVRG